MDFGGDGDPPEFGFRSFLEKLRRDAGSGLVGGKWKSVVEGISSPDDSELFQSLLNLSEQLAMSNEESMGGFPVDAVVPPLVVALNHEYNSEIALLAARCLAHLVEALPQSVNAIIGGGAVGALCAKLFSIEYIDLAEQSLQTLAKISNENPGALLREGGLAAVLTYLDFFPIGVQRVATQTAANICKAANIEQFELIGDAVPNLTNLLDYGDQKVVENTIVAFCRLAEAVGKNVAFLERITAPGLLQKSCNLLSGSAATTIGPGAQGQILRLLSALCQSSYKYSIQLHDCGLLNVLQARLSALAEDNATTPNSTHSEQIFDLLTLANELLPALPQDVGRFVSPEMTPARKAPFGKKVVIRRGKQPSGEIQNPDLQSSAEIPKPEEPVAPPELVIKYGQSLYVHLTKLFASTVNPRVRSKCLSALTKVIYFSTAEMLTELLREYPFSRFLATLLVSPDLNVRATGMCNARILMEKLPEIFTHYFQREGVVHEIDRMSTEPPPVLEDLVSDVAKAEEVRDWLVAQSKEFLARFFSQASGVSSELVEKLQGLAARLLSTDELSVIDELKLLLMPKEDVGGITIHEFNQSGVFPALLAFLTVHNNTPRLKHFAEAFMNLPTGQTITEKPQTNFADLPLQYIVSALQHTIAKFEQNPIYLNPLSLGNLKLLTQPLKLKLVEKAFLSAVPTENTAEPLTTPWHEHSVRLTDPARGWRCDTTEEQGGCRRGVLGFAQTRDTNRFRCTEGCDYDLCEACVRVHFPEIALPSPNPPVLIEPLAPIRAIAAFLEGQSAKNPAASQDDSESDIQDLSASGNIQAGPTARPKYSLYLDGALLRPESSIFEVLQQQAFAQAERFSVNSIWGTVHTLSYGPADDQAPVEKLRFVPRTDALSHQISELGGAEDNIAALLSLLKVFYLLNRNWFELYDTSPFLNPWLSPALFVSTKLNAKVLRQLQDPLALCSGTFPLWIHEMIAAHSHLFSYEVRQLYFTTTTLGIARSLQAIQAQLDASEQVTGFRVNRTARQKVRVSREAILPTARKLMSVYGPYKTVIEIEYLGEVGTGLGPTLEFYTLVSRELQKKTLGLWYDESDASAEYVRTINGLYPLPKDPATVKPEEIDLWTFLGTFIAKSILDERLLDLPLGLPFFKLIINERLDINDILNISPQLGKSLRSLYSLRLAKQRILDDSSLSDAEKQERVEKLTLGGVKLEDVMLDFTFPGTSWELMPGGSQQPVTIANLEQYLDLLMKAWTHTGIQAQLDAFLSGFNRVISSEKLPIFTPEELSSMICGSSDAEYWKLEELIKYTKCDHGYTQESKQVLHLFEAMQQFSEEERQQFLTFVTGSPRLPVGGWANLHPRLTVVRRELTGEPPDTYLPSVNCCFHFIKLPEYTCFEILREKLIFSIRNGQGRFDFN